MLPAQAVVDPERPALGVGEHAVDPRQHDVRRRRADHLGVVPDVPELGVTGPAVAHHRAAGGDVGRDEAAERRGRVVRDHREPHPPRGAALDLDRAGDEEPAFARAAGPGADRVVLGPNERRACSRRPRPSRAEARVRDRPWPAGAWRTAATRSCRCPARAGWSPSWRAEIPLRCAAISQAARNHVLSGRWLPCRTVPAVTEVCRSHAAHCRTRRPRPSSQARSWPQAGQRKPSGQRLASSQRAQAASSGNRASNSGNDRGRSPIPVPPLDHSDPNP